MDFVVGIINILSFNIQEGTVTPVLNGWVLGAYTAMLGRLSAATAALEATEVPNIPSDSDSESEHSSYTEKYVELIEFNIIKP